MHLWREAGLSAFLIFAWEILVEGSVVKAGGLATQQDQEGPVSAERRSPTRLLKAHGPAKKLKTFWAGQ